MSSLVNSIFGSGNQLNKVDTLNPQQGNLQQSILQWLQSQSGQGEQDITQNPLYAQAMEALMGQINGSDQAYQNFSQPYMRQFQEDILPMIRGQYGNQGYGSSAQDLALGRAGENLQGTLASLRESLRSNAINQALPFAQQPISNYQNMLTQGLGTPSFAYHNQKGSPGFLGELSKGLGSAAGQDLISGESNIWKALFSGGKRGALDFATSGGSPLSAFTGFLKGAFNP